MAYEICIFHECDSEPLARFLQEKLSSDDMAIDCLCSDLQTRCDTKYKVTIFLISPEFLDLKKLHMITDFNEKTSVLVLVGCRYSIFEQEVIKQGAETLLDWFVFHLEETDESVKELLVSIISIYELGCIPEDSSENDTEEETGIGLSQTDSIEYHNVSNSTENTDTRGSDYKVLPPRSSVLLNAVKHVFRKDGKVFILLERVAGGKLDVKFHENGQHISPVFASDVYSYVFHWTGTERETFTVKFKEKQIGNGKIDACSCDTSATRCSDEYSPSSRSSTNSASSSSSASEYDDSPYDVLPSRRRNTIIHLTVDNAVPNICGEISPTKEKDPYHNLSLDSLNAKQSSSESTFAASEKPEPCPLSDLCSNDGVLQADFYDPDFLERRNELDNGSEISNSHSTDTLCSETCTNESEFIDAVLHTGEDEIADIANGSQTISAPSEHHQQNKLELLRALLEDEMTRVSSLINSEAEEHEVVLRHPRNANGLRTNEVDSHLSIQSEGDRSTICSIINEEPSNDQTDFSVAKDETDNQTLTPCELPLIDNNGGGEKSCEQTLVDSSNKTQTLSQQNIVEGSDETSNSSKRSSVDKSDDEARSEASDKEEMITFKCDTKGDDDPGFGTDEILEVIAEASGAAKQDLPNPEVDVQRESKPGKKSKFSFKQQIKRIVQRSKSEPKLRQVVGIAQQHEKKTVQQSYSDSGACPGEVLAHSASATGFREMKESPVQVTQALDAGKSTKKKKKGKKSSAADLKRKKSIRIQRVLEDTSLTVPTLTGKSSGDSF